MQVQNRIAGRAEHGALIGGWKISGAPLGRSSERASARILDHDERREVLILASQSIRHPRAYARKASDDRAGVPLVVRERVIDRPALRGMNECQIVDDAAHVREQLGNPLPRLTVLLELIRAAHQRAGIALSNGDLALSLKRFAVELLKHRLVVESVHLADTTGHE